MKSPKVITFRAHQELHDSIHEEVERRGITVTDCILSRLRSSDKVEEIKLLNEMYTQIIRVQVLAMQNLMNGNQKKALTLLYSLQDIMERAQRAFL